MLPKDASALLSGFYLAVELEDSIEVAGRQAASAHDL